MTGAFFLINALLLLSWSLSHDLGVEVNHHDGSYKILLDGEKWFSSAATGFRHDGEWYSSDGTIGESGKKLILSHTMVDKAEDEFGEYTTTTVNWVTQAGFPFQTIFQDYKDIPAVIFHQVFLKGVNNVSLDDDEDVVSAFPSIKVNSLYTDLNYFTWKGVFCEPDLGHWNELDLYHGGSKFGPLLIYNEKLENIIIAPLNNFMVAWSVRNSQSISKNFAAGLSGQVDSIEEGTIHSTILYGGKGISNNLKNWGDYNMKKFGKRRVVSNDDVFLRSMGYYTDNGAYYYYITEAEKNYQDTIIDVYEHLINSSYPMVNYQYDSWWYFKAKDGGLDLWEPREDVFPDGMEKLNEVIDLPLTLHNRWFYKENSYQKLNFSFIVDEDTGIAVPMEKDLFTYIMKKAKDWGLSCYEQDWLSKTYSGMKIVRSDLNVGRNWMMDMFNAAQDLDLTIQLCMPYPVHMMQTLEMEEITITHARASNDYQPSSRKQWNLAYTGMFFYYGLGIIPFKDNFWSSDKKQEGCKYNHCYEVNPVLQTIVSALTGGPIQPADKIGHLDFDLLSECSRVDGVILKADRPAFPIDHVFQSTFKLPLIERLEVWSTLNCYHLGCWVYVFGADLIETFKFKFSMLPDDITTEVDSYYAIEYIPKEEKISSISTFTKSSELSLKKTGFHPLSYDIVHTLYMLVPKVENCRWNFLKEMKKIIGSSRERISTIKCDETSTSVLLMGYPDEVVFVALMDTQDDSIHYLKCSVNEEEVARVYCKDDNCECL